MKPEKNTRVESFDSNAFPIEIMQENKGFLWSIKKALNPPIYATLVAIPLALIPYVKSNVFVGSGAVFSNNIFDALVALGSTVSPLINLLLGSNLSHGYPITADISK